jgi:hypothetical protein
MLGGGLEDVGGTVYLTSVFAAPEELRSGETTPEEIAGELRDPFD